MEGTAGKQEEPSSYCACILKHQDHWDQDQEQDPSNNLPGLKHQDHHKHHLQQDFSPQHHDHQHHDHPSRPSPPPLAAGNQEEPSLYTVWKIMNDTKDTMKDITNDKPEEAGRKRPWKQEKPSSVIKDFGSCSVWTLEHKTFDGIIAN